MGMFIRVTNPCLATHHLQYRVPQHVCGTFGRLPDENFGSAFAKLFPHAATYRNGDPLTPALLKIDGSKLTKGEQDLINSLPVRVTLDQFWEHLNAPRRAKQDRILEKVKAAFGLSDLIMIQPDFDSGVFLRPTMWFADAVQVTPRKLRKVLRKDEFRLVMGGGLDYTNISLRPF